MTDPTQANIDAGATKICDLFTQSQKPFFIGRNGSTEMETLHFWYNYRSKGIPYPGELLVRLQRYSGIFPATPVSYDRWAKEYVESLRELDGLAAGWYKPYATIEETLLDNYAPHAFRMPLRSLEPYYVEPAKRWTASLAGKPVVVISSFAETIRAQTQFADVSKIWESVESPETILNSTIWIPIRTYFPPAISQGDSTGWAREITNWEDAVSSIVKKVLATGASTAVIGCGGLGMIIGARLKRSGLNVILMGGAIQVLFGIKGARWETHNIISKFWNSAWVYPSSAETPSNAYAIEGACYWGGSKPSSTPR